MITVLIFLMIFVGVTAAWYQIYQMHFNINTPNGAKLSGNKSRQLDTLTAAQETSLDEPVRHALKRQQRASLGVDLT